MPQPVSATPPGECLTEIIGARTSVARPLANAVISSMVMRGASDGYAAFRPLPVVVRTLTVEFDLQGMGQTDGQTD